MNRSVIALLSFLLLPFFLSGCNQSQYELDSESENITSSIHQTYNGYTFEPITKDQHLAIADTSLSQLYYYWQQDPDKAKAFAELQQIDIENDQVRILIITLDESYNTSIKDSIIAQKGRIVTEFETWIGTYVPIPLLQETSSLPGISTIQLPIKVEPITTQAPVGKD